MSFTNAMGDRKDDVRFRHPQSSLDDTPFPRYPPSRIGNAGLMLPPSQPASASTSASASEPRATLPRRFTTESAWLPSVMPFGQSQPVQTAEPLDLSTSVGGSAFPRAYLVWRGLPRLICQARRVGAGHHRPRTSPRPHVQTSVDL